MFQCDSQLTGLPIPQPCCVRLRQCRQSQYNAARQLAPGARDTGQTKPNAKVNENSKNKIRSNTNVIVLSVKAKLNNISFIVPNTKKIVVVFCVTLLFAVCV